VVAGVHDPRSLGVHRYVERLSGALGELAVAYHPAARACAEGLNHFHLANSTRTVLADIPVQHRPFLLTLHDVMPRVRALRALQRMVVLPLCTRRASRVIVHSRHAADLLARSTGIVIGRVAVVSHPAPRPSETDARSARRALDLAQDGPPLFVLPGVLKSAKLVAETVEAAAPLLARGQMRLLLAGHVADERVAVAARAAGASLLRDPRADAYEHAIVAADVVLCLRDASVGESNGPLLDAIGAGRASLVTGVGSGPEVAASSGRVVAPNVAGIRAGLEAMLDAGERRQRAAIASSLAVELTWARAAERHRELLGELTGA
jgi:glycosyltransferase involved in cell wall biosynthesis